jgi:selenocysteine-specific elongation factor
MATRHVVFGTAGHVDHGKSTLVLALTGTDPDRWAEEKAREMTIDLGFAFLPLPGVSDEVAIVDVPGHEMFVRNMVAGATGIDAAILVVDADEGVMPQTVEHFDVLRYLGVATGVIALTKIDKALPDRMAKARTEIANLVAGSFLEGAKVVPVSAISGEGMDAFRSELAAIAASVEARPAKGIFREPIDRVFSVKGAGTVITGTVISGELHKGDTVVLLPQNIELRTRNLHVHDQPVESIHAGQRAAVNLADISKDKLQRGDVLATPGALASSLMMDVRLTLSSRAPRPLKPRTRVRIHHGTKEVMARVILLESDLLHPGESGLVQLRLEASLVPAADDPFVVRSYSPMLVIGGGRIVDAHPPKRRKARGASDVARRETSPTSDILMESLDRARDSGMAFNELQVASGLSESALIEALAELKTAGKVHEGRKEIWYSAGAAHAMQEAITAELARRHAATPLYRAIALNDITAGVAKAPEQRALFRIAMNILQEQGAVIGSGGRVSIASHEPQWMGDDDAARASILDFCADAGIAVPPATELAPKLGLPETRLMAYLDALVENGTLALLAPKIYCLASAIEDARERVIDHLNKKGQLTIGEARDLLGASRKFLLPLLERMDQEGITKRDGNARVLR